MLEHTEIHITRRPKVLERFGISNSCLHKRIQQGLIPRPISLGGARAVGWLEHELNAVLAYMAAEKSDDQIKELVSTLVNQRKNVA